MNTVKFDSKQAKVIAHRGLSGIEKENTAPSFVAAGNRSYFGIETDVHKTKDGKFVIIHDETLTRVTFGKHNLNVEESNFSELENIILPDKDGSLNRRDIRIPVLSEYVKICKKYAKICVLELKQEFTEDDLKAIVKEIKDDHYLENTVFISFVEQNCIIIKKLCPNNVVQFLTNKEVNKNLTDFLKKYNLELDIDRRQLTKEIVDILHNQGIKINCWTVDIKDEAEKLVSYGVDYITTNILE